MAVGGWGLGHDGIGLQPPGQQAAVQVVGGWRLGPAMQLVDNGRSAARRHVVVVLAVSTLAPNLRWHIPEACHAFAVEGRFTMASQNDFAAAKPAAKPYHAHDVSAPTTL